MLNRQWFYLTVCGNNSFTYVFHKCDPIPSQGRYKPTLSIEYNLQRFSHTKGVDELSYKRHPVLGTNNSSHSFLKNDYRTTTERSRPGWCLLWEWIQIGNHFTRSFKLLETLWVPKKALICVPPFLSRVSSSRNVSSLFWSRVLAHVPTARRTPDIFFKPLLHVSKMAAMATALAPHVKTFHHQMTHWAREHKTSTSFTIPAWLGQRFGTTPTRRIHCCWFLV